MERSRWHSVLVYFGLRDDEARRRRFEQEPMGPWQWVAVAVTVGVLLALILLGLGIVVQTLGAVGGLFVIAGAVRALVTKRRSGS